MFSPNIIVALDFSDADSALHLAGQLSPELCRLKVGKELFTSCGPDIIKQLIDMEYDVFLDLKFHDIPNTVARACEVAARLGVWMLTVHASGGSVMMKAALEACKAENAEILLMAVTILTSLDKQDLKEIGFSGKPENHVKNLAQLAQLAGLNGVVCSPLEIALLRKQCGSEFQLVTPGIRSAGSEQNDQKRVMTPHQALAAGANYLVVGRPVTQADNPLQALIDFSNEL